MASSLKWESVPSELEAAQVCARRGFALTFQSTGPEAGTGEAVEQSGQHRPESAPAQHAGLVPAAQRGVTVSGNQGNHPGHSAQCLGLWEALGTCSHSVYHHHRHHYHREVVIA